MSEKMNHKLGVCKAFSLIEVSLTLLIIGITLTSSVSLFHALYIKHNNTLAQNRLNQIKLCLKQYVKMKGYLPYAEDEHGNPNGDVGFVPCKALGLPREFGLNETGEKLRYVVHPNFTPDKDVINIFDQLWHRVEFTPQHKGFIIKQAEEESITEAIKEIEHKSTDELMFEEFIKRDNNKEPVYKPFSVKNVIVCVVGIKPLKEQIAMNKNTLILRRFDLATSFDLKQLKIYMPVLQHKPTKFDQSTTVNDWQTHIYTDAFLAQYIMGVNYASKKEYASPGLFMPLI